MQWRGTFTVFSRCNGYSPVTQDFIWLGEYVDGTHLAEFDFTTKQENNFYRIQRSKLIRFGLVGHGQKLFFEKDGTFNLAGRIIDVTYSTPDKDYFLTGNIQNTYTDIISYKDAEARGLANFSPMTLGNGGNLSSTITQYNFGYKSTFLVDNVTIHFKAICCIPFQSPFYMNFWLVSDKKLDGKLQIRVNGLIANEFHSPLRPNIGGELNWQVI